MSETDENGRFVLDINRDLLGWKLSQVKLAYYAEILIDLSFEYEVEDRRYLSRKAIVMPLWVEDRITSMEELCFSIDCLQAELFDYKDYEDLIKWEWSMVPVVRKYGEKTSKMLDGCEICGNNKKKSFKHYKQCRHCGRWIGKKCTTCWEENVFKEKIYCKICSEMKNKNLEALRAKEPKK
jgi:hypothetical protein